MLYTLGCVAVALVAIGVLTLRFLQAHRLEPMFEVVTMFGSQQLTSSFVRGEDAANRRAIAIQTELGKQKLSDHGRIHVSTKLAA